MLPDNYVDPEINPEAVALRRERQRIADEEDRCRRMAQCAAYLAASKRGFPDVINETDIARLVDANRPKRPGQPPTNVA